MNHIRFLETFTQSGGFVPGKVPNGCSEHGHTHLFRSEEQRHHLGVMAYRNVARNDPHATQLYIEVRLAGETFIKTLDVGGEEDLHHAFHEWAKAHDGVNTPEQIASNMAALHGFMETAE